MFSLTTKLALLSRLLLLILQLFANLLIPDHNAGVFLSPKTPAYRSVCNQIIHVGFSGLRRWDAEYFLHIAEYGYTYENTLAFYPLFPFTVRYATEAVSQILPAYFQCSKRNLLLIVALILNAFFFTMAARMLQRLSELVLGDRKKARLAVILFCFNPASVFFSAPYSESLYTWLTFAIMLKCVEGKFWTASVPLTLALLCRSNGLINIGFLLYFCAQRVYSKSKIDLLVLLEQCRKVLIIIVGLSLTFAAMQFYFYSLYCIKLDIKYPRLINEYARKHNYVLAGSHTKDINASPWCQQPFALSYSYIQSHYWDVGFLNYYEWKQMPNFLLALPILLLFLVNCAIYLKRNFALALRLGMFKKASRTNVPIDANLFVFIIHGLTLSIVCVLFVHIQVSTRMLASSSPLLYWLAIKSIKPYATNSNNISEIFRYFVRIRGESKLGVLIKFWFLSYFCIGTVLFANFLPWT
jgi:phosphatidylinositol glycan class V